MTSAITDWAENATLEHIFGVSSMTAPTNVFVALHDGDPSDTGRANEISGSAYARTQLSLGSAAAGTIATDADATFPTATGSWGTITHATIWTLITGGQSIFQGALAADKTVGNGDTFKFSSGNLTATLT